MKVVYSVQALEDMGWFRRYYSTVFPEGKGKARDSLLRTEALIAENPRIGHPTDEGAEKREFPVLRTPFVVLYRQRADRVEILRVVDLRADR